MEGRGFYNVTLAFFAEYTGQHIGLYTNLCI